MPEPRQQAIKWWIRHVIVPLISGIGVLALLIALFLNAPAVWLVPTILLAAAVILWKALRFRPADYRRVPPPMILSPKTTAVRGLALGTSSVLVEAWTWFDWLAAGSAEETYTARLLPAWWIVAATGLAFVGGVIAVKLADQADGAGLLRAGALVVGLVAVLGALPLGCFIGIACCV